MDLHRSRVVRPLTPLSANNAAAQQPLDGAAAGGIGGAGANVAGAAVQVYGTDVDIQQVMASFKRFFEVFIPSGPAQGGDDGDSPLYPRLLVEAMWLGRSHLDVDCRHLRLFDAELYSHLCAYPAEVIPAFDEVLKEKREEAVQRLREEEGGAEALAAVGGEDGFAAQPLESRPFGLHRLTNMRGLNPEDIDSFIAVQGMVIRCGSLLPEMRVAYFQCTVCGHGVEVSVTDGELVQPTKCHNALCLSSHSYSLIHNRCSFEDKQLIKLQETPDSIPEGETPHSLSLYVYRDVVDSCKPGDRIEVTGVFRATAARANPRQSTRHTVYKTYVDGIHIRKQQHNHNDRDRAGAAGEEEEEEGEVGLHRLEQDIRQVAADPSLYARLVASLAPSIWEMDDVKKGLLCQLFGGRLSEEGAGHGRFRGELNVLMCGDPGTSKSQLLQYVHKLAPRGIYTSGKGSSAVGLTASISKDVETGELLLESGALVLSDRGVCCIDEFDKMSDSTRSILHEVMEQQTVSIAKAGIVCTLNARTSILASANPKESRYNPNLSVVDNIQIMPTLLSRFDLIYLILDQPNEHKDRRLAKHLVSLYFQQPPQNLSATTANGSSLPLIPIRLLTAYIAYARAHCRPTLTEDAKTLLIEGYRALRRVGQMGTNKVVTATPRQLEALIRLSEALARMRLSPTVQPSDVMEARRLMDVATQSAATDPATGRIDMDLLMTGQSSEERKREGQRVEAMRDVIEQLTATSGGGRAAVLRVSAILAAFNTGSSAAALTEEQCRKVLEDLIAEGFITRHGAGGRNADTVRKT